jgi:GDP-L-fucose synthase
MDQSGYWEKKKILITGGAGFIGSAVVSLLNKSRQVSLSNIIIPRSSECDLRLIENCKKAVDGCDIVIHLAAVTGGIGFSRKYPAQQYYDSTLIDLNMVEASRSVEVQKFVAIGNLFAYAADVSMPIREEDLFNGLPTDAHRGVGWFKRNLALLADLYFRQYRFPMVVVYSANAYGPNDSLDPNHAHVIPSTIMKCFRDKELVVWGDGSPTRDFLFVDDIAEGLLLAAEKLSGSQYVNIGSGKEISVKGIIETIVKHSGFSGKVSYDISKGGGDPRRFAGTKKAEELLGFVPKTNFEDGMKRTVDWYKKVLKI